MLVGGFFYAGFEKPLEGRIGSKEHLNMGSITIGHARKLLPITFLNCHAFGEAVFGGEVSRRRIFLLREHRHHTEKENNYGSKDFRGWERRGMIDIWEFIINIKVILWVFFRGEQTRHWKRLVHNCWSSSPPWEACCSIHGDRRCRCSLPPLEFATTVTRDWRHRMSPPLRKLTILFLEIVVVEVVHTCWSVTPRILSNLELDSWP